MNIVILAGNFFPEIHPRSFRATELAKEFVRLGHQVTVICCRTIDGFDYERFKSEEKINIELIDVYKGDKIAEVSAQRKTLLLKLKRFVISYFFSGNLFRYGKEISDKLNRSVSLKQADLVISLSTPFSNHYGLSKYLRRNVHRFVTVADSGDPFYYSKQSKKAVWFKGLERRVYKQFNYLTIPTVTAKPLYLPFISDNKIRVIPQGFNMRNLKLYEGEIKGDVRFAYAGVFYWDIRNPEFLFKFLNDVDMNYTFYVYMRYKDKVFEDTLLKYPHLARKTQVRLSVDHDTLLYELSSMHFLLNIENLSNTQMPSKLIDYGMTGRPILSCNEKNFSVQKLKNFLYGDYNDKYEVNIEDYNIEKIARQFLDLV